LRCLVAFVVAERAVAGISEPYCAVGVDCEIVRGIERLALVVVGQNRDGSVVLCARDAAGIVLAGDEVALAIARIAIAVIRRLAEDADFACIFEPAQYAVVGNVTPEQIAAVAEPDRAFGPATSGVQALDGGIADKILGEARIDHFDRRVGVVHRILRVSVSGESRGLKRHGCGGSSSKVEKVTSFHSRLSCLR